MMTSKMPTMDINDAYESARDQWLTCDWQTEFGPLKMNLNGLRSVHLERLAHATSGQESRAWRMAATWVREIEAAAAKAQELAMQARDRFFQQNLCEAIKLIEQACELERRWHSEPVWQLLEQAIRREVSMQANGCTIDAFSTLRHGYQEKQSPEPTKT